MTSPAVLPGVAVRVSRTAPGRRALQLALLVGGLLALGFFCGQRAQAAEGATPPSLTSVVTQKMPLRDVVTPHRMPGAARKPVTEAVPVVDGVDEVVRSVSGTVGDTVTATTAVTETVAETVTETVISPVASALTETLAETVRQVTELPALPVVQVPGLPVVSEPPVVSIPAPVTPVPGPAPGQAQPRTPVTHETGHETSGTDPVTKAAAATAVSYGPRITGAVTFTSGRVTPAGGHRAARAVGAPAHPAPTGAPDGAPGKSAVDGNPSQHGDAHAVTFAGRAPVRLVSGAAAHPDAAGTRDRYRDIPVFPG
ncbi:hypothetical protein [Streptomyces shenzhenensis]|uniref:hypothetical protein n=1 Tax=Streptomyces shenzhenensis TaxID=943815 RepID=UPI001F4163C2|nr:hypothetical protein [Streptomyces shenzhenensis]